MFYSRAGRERGVLSSAGAYPLSCTMVLKRDKHQEKKVNVNCIFRGDLIIYE